MIDTSDIEAAAEVKLAEEIVRAGIRPELVSHLAKRFFLLGFADGAEYGANKVADQVREMQ
jgi:hypothetical protein